MTVPSTAAEQQANRLREVEAELEILREELAETNRGVVALYAELEDKADQLRNVSELKSRFLSYVSHEFRTPLGSIVSVARILLDRLDGPLTAEQTRQVTLIQGSAVELLEMVNDQLDLAKLEAGRLTVSPAWFDMVDLFSALRGIFKPILVNEAVSLTFVEPEREVRLYSDDKKLAQILRNFISNALKFTVEGEVAVRAFSATSGMMTFSVTDTGIGISPDDLTDLFQDYSQARTLIHRKVRGTGLGLALSRRLARLLGGEVSATSTLGQGSTFSVTIPSELRLPEAS